MDVQVVKYVLHANEEDIMGVCRIPTYLCRKHVLFFMLNFSKPVIVHSREYLVVNYMCGITQVHKKKILYVLSYYAIYGLLA